MFVANPYPLGSSQSGKEAEITPEQKVSFVRTGAMAVVALILAGLVGIATHASKNQRPALALPINEPRCSQSPTATPALKPVSVQVVNDGVGVLIVAKVCVDGYGPFPFMVDTGASRSAISLRLAAALHLLKVGGAQRISGIACTTNATPYRVPSWSMGPLTLDSQTVLGVNLADSKDGRPGIAGLLGSDVLSRFDAVRVDYLTSTMTLLHPEHGPPSEPGIINFSTPQLPSSFTGPTSGPPLELSVIETSDFTTALVSAEMAGAATNFIVDTGAAISALDQTDSRTLAKVGRTLPLTTAGCVYNAEVVTSSGWKIGGGPPFLGLLGSSSSDPGSDRQISVPATSLVEVPLPESGDSPIHIQGSLGENVLAGFHSIVLDYQDAALLLGGPGRTS
ncbi:MAG TPA: aspartyl protease family protein [Acidimicrobiales bacterium]|jgi:predicted aspartyl protease|nr:aspartyl protease family protein [Acidimicrobiales bacterium]